MFPKITYASNHSNNIQKSTTPAQLVIKRINSNYGRKIKIGVNN